MTSQVEEKYYPPAVSSEEDSDGDEDSDDERMDLETNLRTKQVVASTLAKDFRGRKGLSTETTGELGPNKENSHPNTFKKSEEVKAKLKETMLGFFMFKALDDRVLDACIDAMEPRSYE